MRDASTHDTAQSAFAIKARVDIGLVQNGTSLPSTTFSWQSMQIQILTPLHQRAVLALRDICGHALAATACGQLRYVRVC